MTSTNSDSFNIAGNILISIKGVKIYTQQQDLVIGFKHYSLTEKNYKLFIKKMDKLNLNKYESLCDQEFAYIEG